MGLFGFGKKKEEKCDCGGACAPKVEPTCDCGGACAPKVDVADAKVVFLGGACCKKSAESIKNVKEVAALSGIEVAMVEDPIQIASYGVMQTPGLMVGGKVVSIGKLITVDAAKKHLNAV